ncbi:CCA tRNA nucleotidyltransferase [Thermodesulfobacteriota bacterium]
MPSLTMNNSEKLHAAQQVLLSIEKAGGQALIVGGAVRDQVMGMDCGDIDIATNLSLDSLGRLFPLYDVGKNKDFNIRVIRHNDLSFEVACFRGETRHDAAGKSVGSATTTFEEDAARRDFTMNAMAMDARGEIIDPFCGRADIEAKLVRCVGDPKDRMAEDPLRTLRAIRFAAKFGFAVEPETALAVREIAPRLSGVAVERITEELNKMAKQPGPLFANAIQLMADFDLLKHVLPEIEALRCLAHDPKHHPEGGVFEHTLAALRSNSLANPVVNVAILLHDVGKAETLGEKEGCPTYYGHDQAGVAIIKALGGRLRWSKDFTEAIAFAAEHHMLAMRLDELRPSKRLRLVATQHWPVLKQVTRSDLASRGDGIDVIELENKFTKAEVILASQPLHPVITGKRVMELTGLPEGPEIGKIIREVTDWAMDSSIKNRTAIESRVKTHGNIFKQ